MLQVKDNNIYLTRGDYAELELKLITPSGKGYILQEGETAVFSVRRKPLQDDLVPPLVKKEFSGNILTIETEDTKFFKYGKYLWDIQVANILGQINTVAFGHLILMKEVG